MKQNTIATPRARATRRLVLASACLLASFGSTVPETAEAANGPFLTSRGGASAPSGAQALCQTYSWACARATSREVSSQSWMTSVAAVNVQVNRTVHALEDTLQYGVAEHWALPTNRGGDCEDIALLKKRELIAIGVDPKRLLIATALDRRRNAHAVLVFRSDKGDLVLDNLTNEIRTWSDTGYLFLRMQDPNQPSRWVNVFAGG